MKKPCHVSYHPVYCHLYNIACHVSNFPMKEKGTPEACSPLRITPWMRSQTRCTKCCKHGGGNTATLRYLDKTAKSFHIVSAKQLCLTDTAQARHTWKAWQVAKRRNNASPPMASLCADILVTMTKAKIRSFGEQGKSCTNFYVCVKQFCLFITVFNRSEERNWC